MAQNWSKITELLKLQSEAFKVELAESQRNAEKSRLFVERSHQALQDLHNNSQQRVMTAEEMANFSIFAQSTKKLLSNAEEDHKRKQQKLLDNETRWLRWNKQTDVALSHQRLSAQQKLQREENNNQFSVSPVFTPKMH